jgi:uncharacterized repeat protein (TIGR03803 family)
MKTLAILLAAGLLVGGSVSSNAQTLTTIYNFDTKTNSTGGNIDGTFPNSLIVGFDGNLYGTAAGGGTNGEGTAFKLTTAGTLTILHEFCNTIVCPGAPEEPNGIIQASDTNFYGTTSIGGAFNQGTVFKLTPQGTFTTIYNFCSLTNCFDGNAPEAPVIQAFDGNFYGTTKFGGSNDFGTIFRLTPEGTLTTLYNFTAETDGASPDTTLFQGSDTNFYGIMERGGSAGDGVIFQLTSQGTFTETYSFCTSTNTEASCFDGNEPFAPLIEVNGNLFGSTVSGGTNNITESGERFEIPLDGAPAGSLIPLYSFCPGGNCNGGSFPTAALVFGSDTNFYGTTSEGGTGNHGTVFQLTPAGVLTTLHSFCTVTNDGNDCVDGELEGAHPVAAMVQAPDGNFYGVTDEGGTHGDGIVFKLDMGLGGSGGGCNFELGQDSGTFTAVGGNSTVSVTASNGCTWSATNNDSFITITSGSSGSGNGTVHYTVAANSSTNPVTGTMTIAGNTFTVTQAGAAGAGSCTFTLKPTVITLTDKGGKKSVSIKAVGTDCAWTAVSNDPFITVSAGSSGTGNGKVEITVGGNTNTTALSGTLTIAGQTVAVNQAVGGCTFKLSPKDKKFKSTGGSSTVKVTPNFSDCAWAAVSNDSFITITGASSGVGKGTVTYTVAANAITNSLTGTITVAGQTFTVIEAGEK